MVLYEKYIKPSPSLKGQYYPYQPLEYAEGKAPVFSYGDRYILKQGDKSKQRFC